MLTLAIAAAELETILRGVLNGSRSLTPLAALGRSRHTGGTEFLARLLSPERPGGEPEETAVFWGVSEAERLSPESVAGQLRDAAPRVTLALALGTGELEGRATGCVRPGNGELRPLDGVRVVGPELPFVALASSSEPESTGELRSPRGLHSRQIGVRGLEVFNRMRRLHVAIIGTGSTGSILALTLGRQLGQGRITLVDPDPLKEHNLGAWACPPGETARPRVGTPKVEVLAAQLRSLPDPPEVHTVTAGIENWAALAAVKTADVLITCVDRARPRMAAAFLASLYLKVHVDVGSGVFLGSGPADHEWQLQNQERARSPENWFQITELPEALLDGGRRSMGSDVRLILPRDPIAGCLHCAAGVDLDIPVDPKPADPRPFWAERAGSHLPLNTVAAMEACELLLDLVAGLADGSRHRQYDRLPGGLPQWRELPPGARSAHCPICRRSARGDAALGELPEVLRELLALQAG